MLHPPAIASPAEFLATEFSRRQYDEVVVEDHLLVLCHVSQQMLLLNPMAATFWALLKEGVSIGEIAEEVAERFGVCTTQVRHQLHDLVSRWREALGSETSCVGRVLEAAGETALEHPSEHCYQLRNFCFSIRYSSQDVRLRIHPLCQSWQISDVNPSSKRDVSAAFSLSTSGPYYLLWKDGQYVSAHPTLEALKGALFSSIAAGVQAEDWLAVFHAAALSCQGHCIVMPAKSGSGKSSLAAFACASGLGYLGDDMVPIARGDQRVWPIPTALSVKRPMWREIARLYPRVMTQPSQSVRDREVRFLPMTCESAAPLPITAVVFPHYQAGQSVKVERVSSAVAVALLLESNSWLGYPLEVARVRELLGLIERLPKYTLHYGDVHQAVNHIKRIFQEHAHGSLVCP